MVVGENPPEGAVLDYYLPAAVSSATLTIRDNAGQVIREYSNVAPPADTTMPNVPEYLYHARASERSERATRTERAGEAASERAC
jgi:hypothetical protein